MIETKFKGIILDTKDYGEADKIANIFSLEYGKISAKFVGVKRPKAKLKPLVQPFTFCDYECIKRGDFFTIKTGQLIDSFPKILSDYQKTICAYIMCDIILQVLPKNKVEGEIFLSLVESLNDLESNNPYQITIAFIVKFFNLLGETLNINLQSQHIYLDLDLGNFSSEKSFNCLEIDKKVYNNLNTKNENDSINKMCLKMLNNIFRAKYDIELKTFSFL